MTPREELIVAAFYAMAVAVGVEGGEWVTAHWQVGDASRARTLTYDRGKDTVEMNVPVQGHKDARLSIPGGAIRNMGRRAATAADPEETASHEEWGGVG